ncbi:hypothetical protein [Nocardioides sp.]|uniref:hypothetical protein n=1 Tax=Nocardioides sp. TaxID=35761 RepID=UPI002B269B1D|nr:hypothetical protein [Nocardioides sp.]
MTGTARLLKVELSRLRARRAVLLLLAAAIVVPAIIAISTVLSTRPPSGAELASVQAQVEAETALPRTQRTLEKCLENPTRYGVDASGTDVQQACEDSVLPQPEWFYYYEPLDLDRERTFGSGTVVVAVLGVVMFLMGATFAGHDWATGSMSNQLLFQPRRARVWAAKALAVTLASLVVAAVVTTAYWLCLGLVLQVRDDAAPDGVLLEALQQGWRGACFAAAGALGGYVLTMLSRSTVFSLGALFAVSVAGGILLGTIGPDDRGTLDPTINAQAIITDGTEYYVSVPERCYNGSGEEAAGDDCDDRGERSLQQGVTYYGVLLAGVGAASLGSFRRRDVS